MMQAIGNTILFSFHDKVQNGSFIEHSDSGIFVGFVGEETGKTPRKIRVHAVGPDVVDIKVGMDVLVTPLMWTSMFKYEGRSYWKTEEKHIIGIFES